MLTKSDALIFGGFFLILIEIFLIIRKVGIKKNVLIGLFVMYITLALSVTLFPIPFQELYPSGYTHNFVPFKSITSSFNAGIRPFLSSVVGNIILTMPFGFLITMILKNKYFKTIILFIVSFSLMIELLQLFIGLGIGYWYRNVDIDDLILNTIGGILGWGIYKITPKKILGILE